MAMEPECLEPLNLVIKKGISPNETAVNERNSTPVETIVEDNTESKFEDNIVVLQNTVKSAEAGVPTADQKFLTALYMSSLMQMSNASALRGVSPGPYSVPQNFMQLLAMVEARQRMWQQLSWSVPPNLLRNPVGVPQPYYDGSLTNMNEQMFNSPNSLLTYPLPSTKHEQTNNDNKQTFFKRYTIIRNICNIIKISITQFLIYL